MPKVDLHCHLDGSVPLHTLKKLAIREGIDPDIMNKAVLEDTCKDLKEYLNCFDIIIPVLQTAENLFDATYETIKEISKENVRYLELRFAPLLHLEKGLSVIQVLTSVCQAIEKAMNDYDIKVNLLICAMRQHDNETNFELLKILHQFENKHLVGFDFAGDEAAFNNQKIAPVVRQAKEKGMQITLHSGECGCPHEVVEAIKLGATRIGHGVAIKDNLDALEMCLANNILLEMCPISNIQTQAIKSFEEYPIKYFMKKGILCSINTDNRTVSNTSLTKEYMILNHYINFNYREMKQVNINAISHSFATPTTKKDVYQRIITEFDSVIEAEE
nr:MULTISPECIES: adenosine deaminase [unclassified Gemella]